MKLHCKQYSDSGAPLIILHGLYGNQGNWLYIAGRGTDPRGGRRFNPAKQAHDHDADGSYRRMWGML